MIERKRDFLSEPDDDGWERVWASMQNGTIPEPSVLSLPLDENFGRVLNASISEAPMQYFDYLYMPTEDCPLCSQSTSGTDRLPASLSLEFDQLKGKIGMCAWMHRDCFESLTISDKPAPIPW